MWYFDQYISELLTSLLVNLHFSKPALGIYKGYQKPNATAFFQPFISDIKKLLAHGLKFNRIEYPFNCDVL